MENKYTIRKVFLIYEMPNDYRPFLYDYLKDLNRSHIEWRVADSFYSENDPSEAIDNWLLTSGAVKNEQVLILLD